MAVTTEESSALGASSEKSRIQKSSDINSSKAVSLSTRRTALSPSKNPPKIVDVRTHAAQAQRELTRERRMMQQEKAEKARLLEHAKEQERKALVQSEQEAKELRLTAEQHEKARKAKAAEADAALVQTVQERTRKAEQLGRYIEARRAQLKKEASRRPHPLPPLCCCGLDPLENHVDNCARNCIFYQNPRAYQRALTSLFVRPIVLE